jgi:hypothetical protein
MPRPARLELATLCSEDKSRRAISLLFLGSAYLYHWIRATEPYGQSKLWRRVFEEFQNMGMDEEVVRLVDMDVSFVMRFGPVDRSLLELARRHASGNPLILTTDSPLFGERKKGALSVSTFTWSR